MYAGTYEVPIRVWGMAHIRMTDRKVKSLKPSGDKQIDYWDEFFPGFGLRVSPRGTKTWVYMYRNPKPGKGRGKKRRYKIGTVEAFDLADARKEASQLAGRVASGEDPQGEKIDERKEAKKGAKTFGDLADRYFDEHAKPNKKSWHKDKQAIERDLKPEFGDEKANLITQEDVEALIEGIRDRGAPVQSNRTLEILRGIYSWALSKARVRKEFRLTTSPCEGVKKLTRETARDRVLKTGEIKPIWEAAGIDQSRTAASFKLRLITAQRGGEVHTMRWSDIDLDEKWWTIPAEFSKNNLSHRVPLTGMALDILKALKKTSADPEWVFPKFQGGGPVVNIQKLTARIRRRSKVKNFRPHDIRRSVASEIASMGFPRLTIAMLLNHMDRDITGTYDRHSYDREKREALEAWEHRLTEIIEGKKRSDNVVPIYSKKN